MVDREERLVPCLFDACHRVQRKRDACVRSFVRDGRESRLGPFQNPEFGTKEFQNLKCRSAGSPTAQTRHSQGTMASVTEQARKEANLRLLQRKYPGTNDIVQTATHVVLYEYTGAAWQKSNIEGSLFLAQSPTLYQLIILNRHSPENFVMQLDGEMQIQHQDPYVMFRQGARILGIWFHSAEERIAMNDALNASIDRLKQGLMPPTPTVARQTPPTPPKKFTSIPPQQQQHATPPSNATIDAAASLLTPLAAASLEDRASPGVALDKKSLQLALLSLIQDDRFLDLLHSQYLRVVHARTKKKSDG